MIGRHQGTQAGLKAAKSIDRLQTFGGWMTIRPTMRDTGFGRIAVRTGSFNSAPIMIPLP
jgi:hypothetical protein